MSNRYNRHRHGRPRETSPLRPENTSTSYGTSGSGSRSPDSQPPPPYESFPTASNEPQTTHNPQARRDPSPLRSATITKGHHGIAGAFVFLFLVILGQAVTLLFFYDLPTKLDEHNRVLDRMREQRYAIREEAKLLENERIALRRESNHLERERLALDASTLKMEGERDALESAILRSELERARLEREKLLLEDERQMLEEKKGELRDERLLLEHEKVELREERERWERAREDRVPQGAFWEVIWPAWDCRAYGKREYWGELQNIPGDWTDLEACMNMPAEIKGVTVRRPDRCEYVDGSPHIHAFWMVDWDQPDCKPWHQDITDMGCTNTGSGIRRIEAWVVGINDRPEQDWRLLCESTPFTWNHVTYKSPTHCEAGWFGKKYAMWDVQDNSC